MSRETLRARLEAATPGPWESFNYGLIAVLPDGSGSDLGDTGDSEHPDEDAAFIAHARQDLPALLALADAVAGLRDCPDAHAVVIWRDRIYAALAAVEALP